MKINTVIFDLDGTLLDTLEDLCDGFNYALKINGYTPRTKSEFKNFIGNGVKKAIDRASDNKLSDEEINKITDCFKEYYIKHDSIKTKPYPGILELLKDLKNAGFKTAVVSNKFDDAVKNLCEKYFDNLIDYALGEGYGIKRKPETDGINKVCDVLSSKPEECIYIGDSEVDVLTAKNAKIKSIGVTWGFRSKKALTESGADFLAEKPSDIYNLITQINIS